jgi:hypothetical protein
MPASPRWRLPAKPSGQDYRGVGEPHGRRIQEASLPARSGQARLKHDGVDLRHEKADDYMEAGLHSRPRRRVDAAAG